MRNNLKMMIAQTLQSSGTPDVTPTPTAVPTPTPAPAPTVVANEVTEALTHICDRLDLISYILLLILGVGAAIIVSIILYKCISAFINY